MEDISINILVDAKNEYTKQLTNILVPYIYEGVESIYQDSLNLDSKNVLKQFQNLLQKVPKWNQEMIDNETKRIIDASKCNYLGDLLTAVFVANAKILTAVATIHKGKKIQLRVPQISEFIHKCYIESAREFYKNPYLFDKSCRSIEKHRNLRESLSNINASIVEAVRKLLPMQEILQQYLGDSFGMHEEDISITPQKENMTFNKKFMKYADDEAEEVTDADKPYDDDSTSSHSHSEDPKPPVVTAEVATPKLPVAVAEVATPKLPVAVAEVVTPKLPVAVAEVVTPKLPVAVAEVVTPKLPVSVAEVVKEPVVVVSEVAEEEIKTIIKKVESPPIKVIDLAKEINNNNEIRENDREEEESEGEGNEGEGDEGDGDEEERDEEDDNEVDKELEKLEKEIAAESVNNIKNIDVNIGARSLMEHDRQNRTRRIIRRKRHKEYEEATKKLNKEIGFYNDAGDASEEDDS